MAEVLDYSAGFPGAAAIRQAGYAGAVRYIGFPDYLKCTTRAELDDFTNHGLGMALVFEHYTTDWRGGWGAGAANYRRARDHANAIGFPPERPIYMAVDQDVVTEAEFQLARDYIRGARDAAGGYPGLVGVYGEHDVCQAVSGDGLCDWYWQCRAWSGTPVRLFPGRHLYQRVGTVYVNGIAADVNDVLQEDWGQHTEDGMPSLSEIENAAYRAVLHALIDAANRANDTASIANEALGGVVWSKQLSPDGEFYAPAQTWLLNLHNYGYELIRRLAANGNEEALAAALLPGLIDAIPRLGDADLGRIAKAVTEERDRRAREDAVNTDSRC
ncbi:glycoside hydrolase domain-containing protein [Saccharothrix syringae]|nr:glycoside hydrolase domain-containing protein [Saccharothrix syringae]